MTHSEQTQQKQQHLFNPISGQPITIEGIQYRFYVFRQDLNKRKDMHQPCDFCDIGKENPLCERINCITSDCFLYLKKEK